MRTLICLFLLWSTPLLAMDQGRFFLMKTSHDFNKKKSTGFYFDPVEQRIVSKTYSWDNQFEQYRSSTGQDFEFPEKIMSFAEVSPEAMKAGYNINVSYDYLPLNSQDGINRAFTRMKSSLGQTQARQLVQKAVNDINTKHKNYQLISLGSKGDDDLGVYYNEKKGTFIFKAIDRDGSNTPKYQFPRKIGLQQTVAPDDNRYDLEKNKVFKARTMYELNAAFAGIAKEYSRYGFSFNSDQYASIKNKMREKMKKFILLRQINYRGKLRKVFYNFDTNEIIYQETKTNSNGETVLTEEKFFSLNDEKGFSDAQNFLTSNRVIGKDQFSHIRDGFIGQCSELNQQDIINYDLQSISNITDRLFEKYLQSAVSNSVVTAGPQNVIPTVNILDDIYKLNIKYGPNGTIENVSFLNPEIAASKGLKVVLEKDSIGQKHFHIKGIDPSTGEETSFIIATSEPPEFDGKGYQGNLVLNVLGQKGREQFSYNGYEKNIYDIRFDNGLRNITGTGKRLRLKGDSRDEYSVGMNRGGGNGFIGFLFHTFYTSGGKKKVIKDKIAEEAGKALLANQDFKFLTNQQEIDFMAEKIANNVRLKTNNYRTSLSKIEAVAASESVSVFGELLLRRTVLNLLPEEKLSTVQHLVNNTLSGFRNCLDRSESYRDKKNAEKCLSVFETEAPVDLGRGILELKLTEAGMGQNIEFSKREYNKCIKEKYDPVIQNEYRKGASSAQDIIKACLYKIVLLSIDKNVEPLINEKMAAVSASQGVSLILSKNKMNKALKTAESCFQQKGLAAKNSYDMVFDFKYLKNLDPTQYEQDLMYCVDSLTENVGRHVTGAILKKKVEDAIVEDPSTIDQSLKLKIDALVESGLNNGYDYCTKIQKEEIAKAQKRYNEEKKRLEQLRSNPNQGVIVNVYEPPFNPEGCADIITSMTLSEVAIDKISEMMGPELWSELTETEEPPEFLQCFSKRKIDALNNFKNEFGRKPEWMNYPEHQQLQRKEEYEKNKTIASDRADANCLKKGITWGSYHLAKDLLKKSLDDFKDDFGDINLTDAQMNLFAERIRSCFIKQFQDKHTVDSVTGSIEKVTDFCSLDMVKNDPNFKNLILGPILKTSLKEADVPNDSLDEYTKVLLGEFDKFLGRENISSFDEFKDKMLTFKADATVKIMEVMLNDKLNGLFKDKLSEEEFKLFKGKLNPKFKELIHGGEPSLYSKLKQAAIDGDKETPKELLAEFKVAATKIVAQEAIPVEANQLLKNNIISESFKPKFVSFSRSVINKCLNQIDTTKPDKVDPGIDECMARVKEKGTLLVINNKLDEEFQGENLKGLFTEEEQKELKAVILSGPFKDRIKLLSKIKDEKKSEYETKLLVNDLTVRASKYIAARLIPKTLDQALEEKLTMTDQELDKLRLKKGEISSESVLYFGKCFDEVGKRSREHLSGQVIHTLDDGQEYDAKKDANKCINSTRLKTASSILNYQFENAMKLVSKNTSSNKNIVDRNVKAFKECGQAIGFYGESDGYADKLDGCLSEILMDFSIDAVGKARELSSDFIKEDTQTMASFNKCFKNISQKAFDKLEGDAPNNQYLQGIKPKLNTMSNRQRLQSVFTASRKVYEADANKRIKIFWIIDEIKTCAFDDLAPRVFDELKAGIFANQEFSLNQSQKDIVGNILEHGKDVISLKGPEGQRVDYKFELPGLNLEVDGEKTYIETVRNILPMVIKYLKQFEEFDNEGLKEEIDQLLKAIKEDIKTNGHVFDANRAIEMILNSKLSDRLIKGFIANEIKTSAAASLSKYIDNPWRLKQVVKRLSSKEMINTIFKDGDPDTKRIFDSVKNRYIRKMLDGSLEGNKPPRTVMYQIKLKLANDTRIGGFAETILAPIAQKELTEARGSWTGGFGQLIGRVNSRDFRWYNIRNRSGGKAAVKKFSDSILKPLLTNGLSNDKLEEAKESLGDSISDLVKDNGEDYNPFW